MIAVLTSGMSLGHYTPALILARRLERAGLPVRTYVHEDLLPERSRGAIGRAKRAYHGSFRFALMAQKVGAGITSEPDPERVRRLFAGWSAAGVRRFVVMSGYWVALVREYARQHAGGPLDVELLHVDSGSSPSWAAAGDAGPGRHVWLCSAAERRVAHCLPTGLEVVPFAAREPRLVVHGGGWGIGSYREFLDEGLARGFACDVRRYYEDDEIPAHERVRELFQPEEWEPWDVDADGRHAFPAISVRSGGEVRPVAAGPDHHDMLELVRGAVAVVSKPGGATLLDSFETATPVVFLAPYGAHEAENQGLWEHLGFGIPLEAWRAAGFSPGVLERLHANLLRARRGVPSYPELYAERVRREGGA